MFCSDESTIIVTLITLILGTALTATLLTKFTEGKVIDEGDYNLAIAVLVFWTLSVIVTFQYGDKTASMYVMLTGINLVVAAVIIHRYNDISVNRDLSIDDALYGLSCIAVAFNAISLVFNLYDMGKSKHFKSAGSELMKGNLVKGLGLLGGKVLSSVK
jgi:hypothetical protein